ncbi:MAG: TetR family transcriptional regulator [Solirubrobacteraceae bacterium]|nr:TetR family transcriptional regulator [Solirubrobacteraceae bacterium]
MEATRPTRDDARRNRDRILDAAALAFARDSAATLASIADAAGLSRATAYRHFADVDAVHAALLEEAQQVGRDLIQHQLPEMFEDGMPVLETIERVLRSAIPLQHRWTVAISNEPVADAGLIDTFSSFAQAFLRRGQLSGELRDDLDLEVVAEALVSLALYAVRRFHADGLSIDRVLGALMPFLDGLRKDAERPAPLED